MTRAGNLSFIKHQGPQGVIAGFNYTYDPMGNRTAQVEEDGAITRYQYDPLYRLTKVNYQLTKSKRSGIPILHRPTASIHRSNHLGDNIAQYRFDAFGGMFAVVLALYSFQGITGKEYDPKSGLMFYNSRWYNPEVGRFIQADTFKVFATRPASQHPYAYGE